MHRRILIYLPASWIILDDNNRLLQSVETGELNQINANKQDEIIVFVPAHDVLLTQATLPKLSKSKLRSAIPYALEEQLIPDVNELHFALANYQPNGTVPVAVVSKQLMRDWLSLLDALKLKPRVLIPTIFLIPAKENRWQINTYHEVTLVRTGQYTGFAVEAANKNILLELEAGQQSINVSETHLSPVELLAAFNPTNPAINLLQGEFQPKATASKAKSIWRLTGLILASWIGLLLLNNLISLFLFKHELKQLETQINQIYFKQFPEAKSVIAPRQRISEKLDRLAGNEGSNHVLLWLALLAKHGTQLTIQHLDYREHHLTLEVTANSFDNLDYFAKAMKQEGIQVKTQSATTAGNRVKASLILG